MSGSPSDQFYLDVPVETNTETNRDDPVHEV